MTGWMTSGWGMGAGTFGWLIALMFWILIIVGIVLAIQWFFGQKDQQESRAEQTALDILKKRYATGEIDREQFEAMKRDLE